MLTRRDVLQRAGTSTALATTASWWLVRRAHAARDKKLVWTQGAGHIITVDYGRERVFNEVESWLRTYDGRSATAAEDKRAAVERR